MMIFLITRGNLDYDASDDEGNSLVDDENIGFGCADMYYATDLLDIGRNGKEMNVAETTNDIIRDLKLGCVANNSKQAYKSAIVSFLQYIYKYDKYLLHNTWIKSLKTLSYKVSNEKKKDSIEKKTIKKLLAKADEKCPPIDFKNTKQNII